MGRLVLSNFPNLNVYAQIWTMVQRLKTNCQRSPLGLSALRHLLQITVVPEGDIAGIPIHAQDCNYQIEQGLRIT